ncbi:MAG: hypothetical protein ACRD04_06700 [Terriglobales bacterium]
MQTYWANFVRSGDPNGGGVPAWPRYEASGHWPVLYLNTHTHAAPDSARARFRFLQSVWEAKP